MLICPELRELSERFSDDHLFSTLLPRSPPTATPLTHYWGATFLLLLLLLMLFDLLARRVGRVRPHRKASSRGEFRFDWSLSSSSLSPSSSVCGCRPLVAFLFAKRARARDHTLPSLYPPGHTASPWPSVYFLCFAITFLVNFVIFDRTFSFRCAVLV